MAQISPFIIRTSITYLVRNPLEQIQHLQRVQVLVHRLVNIHSQLFLCFNCWNKCFFPLLHLFCRLLCTEFVVDDFHRADFLDSTVCCRAVGAIHYFACGSVDSFVEGLSMYILEVWATKPLEIDTSVGLFYKDSSTRLRERMGCELDCNRSKGRRTLHIHCRIPMVCLKYPMWNTGTTSLM